MRSIAVAALGALTLVPLLPGSLESAPLSIAPVDLGLMTNDGGVMMLEDGPSIVQACNRQAVIESSWVAEPGAGLYGFHLLASPISITPDGPVRWPAIHEETGGIAPGVGSIVLELPAQIPWDIAIIDRIATAWDGQANDDAGSPVWASESDATIVLRSCDAFPGLMSSAGNESCNVAISIACQWYHDVMASNGANLRGPMTPATAAAIEDDDLGVLVPIEDLPSSGIINSVDGLAGTTRYECPENAYNHPATGTDELCSRSIPYTKVKKWGWLRGLADSAHPTTGSSHGGFLHATHPGTHSRWSYADYSSGRFISGCKDDGGPGGMHASEISGGISRDQYVGQYGVPDCRTGAPRGWWGGYVVSK